MPSTGRSSIGQRPFGQNVWGLLAIGFFCLALAGWVSPVAVSNPDEAPSIPADRGKIPLLGVPADADAETVGAEEKSSAGGHPYGMPGADAMPSTPWDWSDWPPALKSAAPAATPPRSPPMAAGCRWL